jgi:hypothetical protein
MAQWRKRTHLRLRPRNRHGQLLDLRKQAGVGVNQRALARRRGGALRVKQHLQLGAAVQRLVALVLQCLKGRCYFRKRVF